MFVSQIDVDVFHKTDRAVDPNLISFNKVILLHGPPGTGDYTQDCSIILFTNCPDIGKTSLCRALSQVGYRGTSLHKLSNLPTP
jgi:SpoVK/Ycf46/Vps4 family AAA+-type ATPase